MKLRMKKNPRKIVRNDISIKEFDIFRFLVAPIDGTIISHLISQVKSTFYPHSLFLRMYF